MDQQTGVYTNDYMAKYMDRLFAEHEAVNFGAGFFNIRGMSTLNENFGWETGTALMRKFVLGLQDLIGDSGIVVRMKEDNFIVIFKKDLLDNVVSYLNGTDIESDDKKISRYFSTHTGYYLITENCHSLIDFTDIMNEAIREARNNSNNAPYIFYDDKLFQQISESRRIEAMFPDAIANEEFLVYYQPKVELKRYRLHGAEALCRWKHEDKMILPFKFIPVFERNGDIVELDFYMLEHVCRDLRKWLNEGKEIVRVSVNISRAHMGDRHLVEHILSIIDKYEVPHLYIEIELTETSTDVDYAELGNIVRGLHSAGVNTSVDDFGVGYSSMNLLRELPWNVVKIDKGFVPLANGDAEDEKKIIMLRAIITMAEALGLRCIAEGVETVEQVILLKENGCYHAQGYYFDKPMPRSEFEERINTLTAIVRG